MAGSVLAYSIGTPPRQVGSTSSAMALAGLRFNFPARAYPSPRNPHLFFRRETYSSSLTYSAKPLPGCIMSKGEWKGDESYPIDATERETTKVNARADTPTPLRTWIGFS